MDLILNQLIVDNLPDEQVAAMREQGADLLNRLLSTSIRHVALTRFDPPMREWLRLAQARPAVLPEQGQSDSQILMSELETLTSDDQPVTRTQEMFVDPVVFKRGTTGSLPPTHLPEMPDKPQD